MHISNRGKRPRIRPLVLVPYILSFPGGVRRVLGEGLPRLRRCEVEYAELSRNHQDMDLVEADGVSVSRLLGLERAPVLSAKTGLFRALDLARAIPFVLRLVLRLRAALPRYDVVYVHGVRELFLVWLACRLLGTARRPPVVWHCHAHVTGRRNRLTRWLGSRCSGVIVVSQHLRDRLVKLGIPGNRLWLVYNATTGGGSGCGTRLTNNGRRLLVATAALRPSKGVHTAIAALAVLPKDYTLAITGDTNDPVAANYVADLRRQIKEAGLEERVEFLGYRTNIRPMLESAFALIAPSVCEEAFGLTAVEAMCVRTPAVVSDSGALPEVVGYGDAGLVFVAGDPNSLATQIRRLEDPQTREKVVAAAFGRAVSLFNYSRWAREVDDVLLVARATQNGTHARPGPAQCVPERRAR